MFAVIGILIVFGAVIGGFLMEKGHIAVLVQPAELLILVGAAIGTLLVANPPRILKGIAAGLKAVLGGSKFNKQRYLNALKMMYQFLNKVRKEGLLSVEMDVEKPGESPLFKNFPDFLADHHARDFVCDTLRMAITGGVEPFDMDQMMELDMEVHHNETTEPVSALTTVADALPGLGIVAAVLGVVITMESLGGPPEEIGEKVAAALVALLWCCRPIELQHEQDGRRAQLLPPCNARPVAFVSQGQRAYHRHRDWTARHSLACAAVLRRNGKAL